MYFLSKLFQLEFKLIQFIFRLFYNSCIYHIRNQTSKYLEKFNWKI